MHDFLSMMALPLAACLILTGMHAYLGNHVIQRQVIFVDLALAQIAALGSAVALAAGNNLEGNAAYWFSLGFALVGAIVFSLTRFRRQRLHQEAVIGIVYVVAAAFLILVLSRYGEGDEKIRKALIGNILLVRPKEVMHLLVLYSGIGMFHVFLRKSFFLISSDPERASRQGLPVRFLDFLFYASFALVVTSSVRIAGVLLVFSYLVVPSGCAFLWVGRTPQRLAVGWALGTLGSLAGVCFSYFADYPTGPSVVVALGVIFLVCLLLTLSFRKKLK